MKEEQSFFKQTWVQIVSIIIAASLGGLITFFSATNSKRWEQFEKDHDVLIKTTKDVENNKKDLDIFSSQYGELKAVTDELKWTVRTLKEEIDRLRQ